MKDNVNLNSIVEDFSKYSKENLESMKNDLELNMSLSWLERIKTQYAQRERRDITLGELFLFDWLTMPTSLSLNDIIINELLTSENYIMETFANLNRKRCNQLERTTPILLSEIAEFANSYLNNKDIISPYPEIKTEIKKTDEIPFELFTEGVIEHETFETEEETIHLALSKGRGNQSIINYSRLFLISQKDGTNAKDFEKDIGNFLCSSLSDEFYYIKKLDYRGMIFPLLKSDVGFQLELSLIAKLLNIEPMIPYLTKAGEGCVLMATQFPAKPDITTITNLYNFNINLIGSTAQVPQVTFKLENNTAINIEAAFLRSFFQKAVTTVKIFEKSSTSDEDNNQAVTSVDINLGGQSFNTTYFKQPLSSSIYRKTIESICKSVFNGISKGKQPQEIKTSIELSLINNWFYESQLGDLTSALLGIYRLQTELVLPLTKIKFTETNVETLNIKVLSISKNTQEMQNIISKGGQKIFYLEALMTDDNLPNFNDLRLLIQYVINLYNKKCTVIYSPCNFIYNTVEQSCEENITIEYNQVFKDKKSSPYSFLVVSEKDIEGKMVGRTSQKI